MKHHPDPATLMSYMSGSLPSNFSILVSSHLEKCSECSKNAHIGAEMGGFVLDKINEEKISEGAYDKFLSFAKTIKHKTPSTPKSLDNDISNIPSVLQKYIGLEIRNIKWKFIAPGIKKHEVGIDKETNSYLTILKINPKKKIPEHGHTGNEITLVIEGSFKDEHGQYSPGDISEHDESTHHQPVVSSKNPCICIIATDGPMIFHNFFANLFQRFIRI